MEVYYEYNKKQISFLVGILLPDPQCLFYYWNTIPIKALLQIVGGDKLIIPFC